MQVKCRYCGNKIEKKNAFKDPNKNFYYCNEEHYTAAIKKKENEAREKEEARESREKARAEAKKIKEKQKAAAEAKKAKKDAVYNEICSIFGYEIQNSALFSEWVLWNKLADNEKILAYLQENRDYIKKAMERASNNEYARIRYFSAILKNSLRDYKAKEGNNTQVVEAIDTYDFDLFDPSIKKNQKRRSFVDLEG